MVFHSICDEDIIDFLSKRNVWVDTVENVVKYTHLKNNAEIKDFIYDEDLSIIKFRISTPQEYFDSSYNHNISIKVGVDNYNIEKIYVGNEITPYEWRRYGDNYSIVFDIPFPVDKDILIKLK